jgi:hypothetical protein
MQGERVQARGHRGGGLHRDGPGDGVPGQVGVRLQLPPSRQGRVAPGSAFGMVGVNGSAAYADIDSGVAVAGMRNRFAVGDLTTAALIHQIVARVPT